VEPENLFSEGVAIVLFVCCLLYRGVVFDSEFVWQCGDRLGLGVSDQPQSGPLESVLLDLLVLVNATTHLVPTNPNSEALVSESFAAVRMSVSESVVAGRSQFDRLRRRRRQPHRHIESPDGHQLVYRPTVAALVFGVLRVVLRRDVPVGGGDVRRRLVVVVVDVDRREK